MSSLDVRTKILDFLNTESTEKIVDLTDLFDELQNFLEDNSIAPDDDWVGVQFVGNTEEPVCLSADSDSGTYRELGVVLIHVVGQAKLGGAAGILTRAEALRDLLRGNNIDGVRIDSVSPPNFGANAAIAFDGGWTAATFSVAYSYDKIL